MIIRLNKKIEKEFRNRLRKLLNERWDRDSYNGSDISSRILSDVLDFTKLIDIKKKEKIIQEMQDMLIKKEIPKYNFINYIKKETNIGPSQKAIKESLEERITSPKWFDIKDYYITTKARNITLKNDIINKFYERLLDGNSFYSILMLQKMTNTVCPKNLIQKRAEKILFQEDDWKPNLCSIDIMEKALKFKADFSHEQLYEAQKKFLLNFDLHNAKKIESKYRIKPKIEDIEEAVKLNLKNGTLRFDLTELVKWTGLNSNNFNKFHDEIQEAYFYWITEKDGSYSQYAEEILEATKIQPKIPDKTMQDLYFKWFVGRDLWKAIDWEKKSGHKINEETKKKIYLHLAENGEYSNIIFINKEFGFQYPEEIYNILKINFIKKK